MTRIPGTLVAWAVVILPALASAAQPDCEPAESRVPRGVTVRTALGPAFWVGEVGRDSSPGIGFTFAAGYELFSWLMLEGTWCAGLHNTDQEVPPPPGTFATHGLYGGLRLGVPLASFDLFLRGGAGMMWSRPDILVGIRDFDGEARLGWLGGAGFTWHTPRRHIWIGLEGSAQGADGFPGILIVASAVIGVTL